MTPGWEPDAGERTRNMPYLGDEDQKRHRTEIVGRYKDLSPQEIREKTRLATAKIVAGAAGALEGYTENTDPAVVGRAARKAAEALRGSARAVQEEIRPQGIGENAEGSSEYGSLEGARMGSTGPHLIDRAKEKGSHLLERAKDRAQQAGRNLKESSRGQSPEQVRQHMKEVVGRPVAAATGAMEGFAEQEDPKVMADAARKIARTARQAVSEAKAGFTKPSESSNEWTS